MSDFTDSASVIAEPTQADQVRLAEQAHEQPTSLLDYPATYLLLAVNFIVFGLMFSSGPVPELWRHASHASPTTYWAILNAPFDPIVIDRFGGSATELILLYGQWWRLLSSTFVHVTVLHLLVNMWCLWNLGLFGERLLGRPGLVSVYLLTGAAGMILSLGWSVANGEFGLVAGASGAVFGVAGILIVLLSNRKLSLPWEELRKLRQSVALFAALNLLFGLMPRLLAVFPPGQLSRMHLDRGSLLQVDNSAHLGGFAAGLALGLPLFPRMTSGRSSYRARQALVFAVAAFLLVLVGYGIAAFARGEVRGI